jgi:hypothetical protein
MVVNMTSRSKRRQIVSGHNETVQQPENTWLPPGSGQGDEAYPAVTIVDEVQHNAEQEKAASERVERAKSVSSPRRLNERERQAVAILLDIQEKLRGDRQENLFPIPLEHVPDQIKQPLFETGSKNNLHHRGIVRMLINPETKQYDTIELTEVAFDIYINKAAKSDGKKSTTKATGQGGGKGRRSNKYEGLRLRIMKPDARKEKTMGWYSWSYYRDGMTYAEYLANPSGDQVPDTWVNEQGHKFRGPGLNHWSWDIDHGFTALYRDGEEETLPDGSPNPNYWVVKNVML